MNRDKIIFVGALVSGLLAFAFVYRQLGEAKKVTHSVVLAGRDLKAGDVLTDEMVVMSKPLPNLELADFFLQTNDVVGLAAKTDIPTGKAVRRSTTEKNLSADIVALPLRDTEGEITIPSGLNAVSFSEGEVEDPASFVKVGSYVDILGRPSDSSSSYLTIVYSVPVLQIDRNREEKFMSITFGLLSEEAEILTSGARRARLRVVGRTGPGPKSRRELPRETVEMIRGSDAPVRVTIGAQTLEFKNASAAASAAASGKAVTISSVPGAAMGADSGS